jgi:hypothetical protein
VVAIAQALSRLVGSQYCPVISALGLSFSICDAMETQEIAPQLDPQPTNEQAATLKRMFGEGMSIRNMSIHFGISLEVLQGWCFGLGLDVTARKAKKLRRGQDGKKTNSSAAWQAQSERATCLRQAMKCERAEEKEIPRTSPAVKHRGITHLVTQKYKDSD